MPASHIRHGYISMPLTSVRSPVGTDADVRKNIRTGDVPRDSDLVKRLPRVLIFRNLLGLEASWN